MATEVVRPGGIARDIDPVPPVDAGLRFIGQRRTPWRQDSCPHTLRTGASGVPEVDARDAFDTPPAMSGR